MESQSQALPVASEKKASWTSIFFFGWVLDFYKLASAKGEDLEVNMINIAATVT